MATTEHAVKLTYGRGESVATAVLEGLAIEVDEIFAS